MNKLFFVLFSLSLLLASCDSKNDYSKYETSISGIFYNVPGQEIVLVHQTPEGIFPIDTTYVDENGEFLFTPDISDIGVYRVMIDFSQYLSIVAKKGDHIFLDADGLNV